MPFEDVRSALEAIRDRSQEYSELDVDKIVDRLVTGELSLRGEAVKVVDKSDAIVGEVDRKVAEKNGLIHRTSNAVVLTPMGKIILLRRGVPDKAFYLCISIVGGHMELLDDYEEGCKAEFGEVSETFAHCTITEDAFFTPDLLERIVRNDEQVLKLRENCPKGL